MTIEIMADIARTHAEKTGESVDSYWGEHLTVVKLYAAYFNGFNVGGVT